MTYRSKYRDIPPGRPLQCDVVQWYGRGRSTRLIERKAGLSNDNANDLLVVKALNNVSSVILVGAARWAELHGQLICRRVIRISAHMSR